MNVIDLHRQTWNRLQAWRSRLPHALLFSGQRGLGKFQLAQTFAASLLCENPQANGHACGQCMACGWYAQGNHPDFRLLQPDALAESDGEAEEGGKKKSQQITIDQVRSLDEFFNVGTHRAGLRIILIRPTEAMNRSTANALLKTLEEPAASTLFLLVSDEPMRLLPTLRSRCQTVSIPLPSGESAVRVLSEEQVSEADKWLALAGGAPVLALELAQAGQGSWLELLVRKLALAGKGDALASAAEIDKALKESKGKLGLRQVVDWMQKWTVDLMLAKRRLPVRYFSRQQATIDTLVTNAGAEDILHFYRHLLTCRREVEQPLNSRLFLETVFLDYRVLFAH